MSEGIKSEHANVLKLKRDWIGRKVRLKRQIETRGGIIFKVGEVLEVDSYYRGLELKAIHVCEHCNRGYRATVSRIPIHDVDLVQP